MSRSLDRRRMKKQHDAMAGEAESDKAKTYSNILATLAQAGGEIASTSLKKKEDAQKAQADKAAAEELQKRAEAADKAAADARKKANDAASEARIEALKAQQEKEPYGPLHIAAQKAADVAAMRDSEARQLEAKAMSLRGGGASSSTALDYSPRKSSSGVPTWVWYVAGGVGVLGIGAIGYALIRRKK